MVPKMISWSTLLSYYILSLPTSGRIPYIKPTRIFYILNSSVPQLRNIIVPKVAGLFCTATCTT